MKNITDKLAERIKKLGNPTVAGLDPRVDMLPDDLKKFAKDKPSSAKAVAEFTYKIIDKIKDIVPAVKIQSAFYEIYDEYGTVVMKAIADYAKRAEIGRAHV